MVLELAFTAVAGLRLRRRPVGADGYAYGGGGPGGRRSFDSRSPADSRGYTQSAGVSGLDQAVDKAREILQSNTEEFKLNDEEFIFIRDSNIVRRLKLDDILFAEAMGDYVKLYTPQKFYATHTTLKAVEERLPASKFIRVHRSYIVALTKIDTLQDGALVINGRPVPIADAYRSALNKRMNVL